MTLREKAVGGFAWTSAGTLLSGLLNLLITLILARLLTPADFGLIELLIIFTSLSDIFVDSGFSQAIIRDPDATEKDLSSVFTLNLIIAGIIYTILFFASDYIADFYKNPLLAPMAKVAFLTILFNSFTIIQNANFSRRLNFKPFAIASIGAMVISGITAITLAYMNFGVWALVANLVLLSFFRMIFVWIQSSWRPKILLSVTSIKRYFSFGSKLLVQGITDKIVTNLESLIIGKIYSASDLGYFSQGRKLDSYALQTATNVVQKVSYPILAHIEGDPSRLKNGCRRVLGVTLFCITPIIGFFISSAESVMGGLFGEQWLPSAPYLRLWAICGWTVSFYTIFNNIFLAKGLSSKLLKLSLIRQALRIISIIALIRISIMAMMWGIVAVTLLSGFMYIYKAGKLINYTLPEVFRDIKGYFLCGVAAGISTWLLGFVLPEWGLFTDLIIRGIFFLGVYIGLSRITKNIYYFEVKDIIITVIKKIRKR